MTTEEVRKVFEYLVENGPTKQDELEEEFDLDDGTDVVRQLRHNDLAFYNSNREVECTGEEFNHRDFHLFE